ncbi:hypothetical protein [Paenibacillus dendritiformis]|uniref:hypothetical protein n=1 Tax=Paenibacillus dendritiformis TaxID=130049 RepID=UPI00387E0D12
MACPLDAARNEAYQPMMAGADGFASRSGMMRIAQQGRLNGERSASWRIFCRSFYCLFCSVSCSGSRMDQARWQAT